MQNGPIAAIQKMIVDNTSAIYGALSRLPEILQQATANTPNLDETVAAAAATAAEATASVATTAAETASTAAETASTAATTAAEAAASAFTTENVQGVLSSLLDRGSDAVSAVCEAASDNPLIAGVTVAAGIGTFGYVALKHYQNKNKAAAAKNDKKDGAPAAGNDSSLNAANTSSSNSSPIPREDERDDRDLADTSNPTGRSSPKLKIGGRSSDSE